MRVLRWLARKFWLLTITLVVALAILVQAGRLLSPQVENYRPQISAWLSSSLGVPVRMEKLSLRWQALEVALQLDGLRLGEEGEVRMGHGLFHLDLLASLWNRELVWKELQVHDFAAGLSRGEGGDWHIDGFPVAEEEGEADDESADSPMRLGDPARIFQLGPRVQVRNAGITLRLAGGQVAEVKLPQIQLENSGGFHRLSARAFISKESKESAGEIQPDQPAEETLRLLLEGHGNPRDKSNFALRGYMQLNELLLDGDIVSLLHQLTPLPEKYHWRGRKLARGKLWLENRSESGYSLRGRLSLEQMPEGADGPQPTEPGSESLLAPLESLTGDISGDWQPGREWRLALQDIQLGWRDLEMPPLNLQARNSAEKGLQLAADVIDLEGWSRILGRLEVLDGPAGEWLTALEPSGRLSNIQLARDTAGQVVLEAELHDVVAAAHRGAPAVDGLNGYLHMRGADGHVVLSGGALSAHFPQLYKAPLAFESASGTLAWRVDREQNSVQIYSGPLQMDGETGRVNGKFLLQLPYRPHTRAAEFTLALGVRDAPASAQSLMVPYTVSGDLRKWLNRGLGPDNPGRVESAGFIYRGYSYREGEDSGLRALGAHRSRQTVQLAADFDGAALDYAPGWPAARAVDGRLLVNDGNVQVNASTAKLWNIDARKIEVGVTPSPDGHGSLLGVRAELEGPAADGLKLLRESPLRERIGNAFDQWKLNGRMSGEITLSQPLGGAKLPARQTVQVDLEQGGLGLQNLRLNIDKLRGQVHYDSERGLAGSRFEGALWGRPLSATITHEGEGELRDTRVVVDGSASTSDVRQWSSRPELDWMEGTFDYHSVVTIPARAEKKPYSAIFELNSDLSGVAVNLPEPLAKSAADKTDFVLRVPIGEQGSLFHLNYGEHLQGQFWLVQGALERGSIALNAGAHLPAKRSLAIVGDLSQVDLPRWRQLLAVYGGGKGEEQRRSGKGESADSGSGTPPPLPITLDLSTDKLRLGATSIEHIHARGRGLGSDWHLQFDSETAAGSLTGRIGSEAPLKLELSHLHLPAPKKGEASAQEAESEAAGGRIDPWAGFDFTGLPRLDFSTESLRIGEEELGRWSFELRPSADRLVLSDIRGAARGLRVEGRGDGESGLGAQLMWMRDAEGGESSQFIGRLVAEDLEGVQRAWGQEPAIESEYAAFDTALRWGGSPAHFAADMLSGDLKVDIRKGRFLRATDNAGTSLLRLLSLFNFDTWARRLRLDFSDLYQSGMAFDRVRGEVVFEGDGKMLIAVPIQVEGPTSELQMAGRVNLREEDLNLTLVATLPVGNNLALIAALAGGLPAAAGVYLISKAFKKQVDRMASVSYRISGDWEEPDVRFDKLFDGDGANRQGAAAERGGSEQPREGPAPAQPDMQVPFAPAI